MIKPIIPAPIPKALLLIGAGASYGCGGTNMQVPLGDQLFSELTSYSSYWSSLPEPKSKAFQQGFERAFDYWPDSVLEGMKSPLMWHMAFYFDEFQIIKPESCAYLKLTEGLIRLNLLPHVSLVSLNYDTLFEQACSSLGLAVRGWGDYSASSLAWFIKPHGSSNYLPDDIQVFARGLSGSGKVTGNYKWVSPGKVQNFSPSPLKISAGVAHPIMAHYNRDKFARCGTDLINALREEWKSLASQAKIIIIVGVRPTIYDTHIWTPIVRSPASIVYVNPSGLDRGKMQKLRPDTTMVTEKFEDSIPEILTRLHQVIFD